MARLGKDEALDLDINSPNYGDVLIMNVGDDPETDTGDDVDNLSPVMRESLTQAIRISLLFILGEWFLDTSIGVPYYELIWVKRPNLDHVKSAFRAALLEVPGVREVETLIVTLNARTRKLDVTWVVTTDYGELEGTTVI